MFDHRNFATDGLYPGLTSTFSIAVLGALEIEVILEPIAPIGGGGYGGVVVPRKDKYRLRIFVRRKGREWKYEGEVSNATARVIAKLSGITLKEPEVVVESVSAKIVNREEPTIKVTKR